MESTYNWYWLVDGLTEKGHEFISPTTAAIQQYNGLKYTDDHSDARWLAHLLRLGVLPEGYIYPKEERAVRDLLRKRGQLVHQRTANLLSIQSLISRTGEFDQRQVHQSARYPTCRWSLAQPRSRPSAAKPIWRS